MDIEGRCSSRAGFTLIELLVVIAIIGILASVILASIGGSRAKARDAQRLGNLQQMARAMAIVSFDTAIAVTPAGATSGDCGDPAVQYHKVNTCTKPVLASYADPIVGAAGSVCQGTAGTASTASCQYSISKANGAAGTPTTLDYQICTYFETKYPPLTTTGGLVSISSGNQNPVAGCN